MVLSRNQYVALSRGHFRHNGENDLRYIWIISYTLFMSSIIFFFQFFEKFWSYTSVKIKHPKKQHHWRQWKHNHPLLCFNETFSASCFTKYYTDFRFLTFRTVRPDFPTWTSQPGLSDPCLKRSQTVSKSDLKQFPRCCNHRHFL